MHKCVQETNGIAACPALFSAVPGTFFEKLWQPMVLHEPGTFYF
uniref:ST n=1 Tax=Raja clavata polyomavirus 1 TaxID=3072331 RepID=A0AA51RFA9_9POLY|nr:sT [Raja clavata polyomavirus 1]